MQKISPFLWFDNQAQEAAEFYTSIFPESKITRIVPYGDGAPSGKAGDVMTVEFELFGQKFVALNGGPIFNFTEAVSFAVHCDTQEEIDRYWSALTGDGGEKVQCGWLKDKFGLSWQIVPTALDRYLNDEDPARAQRVFSAMMGMVKLDIPTLEKAYAGE